MSVFDFRTPDHWKESSAWQYAQNLLAGEPRPVLEVVTLIYQHIGGTDTRAALGIVSHLLQFLIDDELVVYSSERGLSLLKEQ
jgi:hypothetical protein